MNEATLYGKPILEQLLNDIVKLHENERDAKRRHKLEMLLCGFRALAMDKNNADATQEQADVERRDLGIPVKEA